MSKSTLPPKILNQLPANYPSFVLSGVIMESFHAPNSGFLLERKNTVVQRIKSANIDLENLKDQAIIQAYRQFYWKYCNIDPTKVRPAGEALLRRLLASGDLPTIHPVVDAFNIVSAETMVPMCAYDYDLLEFPLVFRLSQEGEEFLGIGMKTPKKLAAGIPIIADVHGIISIYPYRDANRTKLMTSTKKIIITADGVPYISLSTLENALAEAISVIQQYCGGQISNKFSLTHS